MFNKQISHNNASHKYFHSSSCINFCCAKKVSATFSATQTLKYQLKVTRKSSLEA